MDRTSRSAAGSSVPAVSRQLERHLQFTTNSQHTKRLDFAVWPYMAGP